MGSLQLFDLIFQKPPVAAQTVHQLFDFETSVRDKLHHRAARVKRLFKIIR